MLAELSIPAGRLCPQCLVGRLRQGAGMDEGETARERKLGRGDGETVERRHERDLVVLEEAWAIDAIERSLEALWAKLEVALLFEDVPQQGEQGHVGASVAAPRGALGGRERVEVALEHVRAFELENGLLVALETAQLGKALGYVGSGEWAVAVEGRGAAGVRGVGGELEGDLVACVDVGLQGCGRLGEKVADGGLQLRGAHED
jgi:hypothetical protein